MEYMPMKKTIITIAGKLGSGKSTTGKQVAAALGYAHKSTGDFMRAMARERGITLEELSKIAETDLSIDTELDDHNKAVGAGERTVLDSRLGFHFIPDSFKVFLDLDPRVAARRILKDRENNPDRHAESSGGFDTEESIAASIESRLASEKKRYKEMYGIEDQTAHENFDLVINTGDPEYDGHIDAVVQKVIDSYNEWLRR